MRKILIVLMLTASTSVFAMNSSSVKHEVRCINGYQFLFAWSGSSNDGPSVIQIFGTTGTTAQPQPLTCRG